VQHKAGDEAGVQQFHATGNEFGQHGHQQHPTGVITIGQGFAVEC
jgi:hypothetical protein